MAGLFLVTLVLSVFAFKVGVDTSGVSFTASDSESDLSHRAFVQAFGTDDYILLAFEHGLEIGDPDLRRGLKQIRGHLIAMDGILGVTDLDSLASHKLPGLSFGSRPWEPGLINEFFSTLPGMNRLISKDHKILGLAVRIDNETLNGFRLEKQLGQMKSVVADIFPGHCHAAGIPVLRAAFERYNLMNALIFGGLGLIFGAFIAYYLFKTFWAGLLVAGVSLVSMIWTLGFMGLWGIQVNLATGLSFGFIPIVSCTTVLHIISVYMEFLKDQDEKTALELTYGRVLRPCFMCALTTAAGFISLTISPIPMVYQAGMIISLGVVLAFGLALPVTSFCLPWMIKAEKTSSSPKGIDGLDWAVRLLKAPGFNYPGPTLLTGIAFCLIMALGIPRIGMVKHLTHPMVKTTPEAMDLKFIRRHLSSGYSFSLVMTPKESGFQSRKFWYDLSKFENRLTSISGIEGIDSITPLIFRMALKFPQAGIMPEKVFERVRSQAGTRDMVRPFLEPVSGRLRLIVHIQDHSSDQIEALLKRVEQEAEKTFAQIADVSLAGQLIRLRSQTADLVSSQLNTLFLALGVITLFMMIQLKSLTLGLLSLIPNLFPLVTIFGIMGWFDIALDPLTIFTAVISFGLSVDDSIHYLTALKEELTRGNHTVSACLDLAYVRTSRALISTTAVLFLSASGLVFASFSHVVFLGVLIASASIAALAGDLMIMPALVLKSGGLHKLLTPIGGAEK